MTFAPWKDKVVIIPKMVGSETSCDEITCSSLLDSELKNIIKMDIEGMEIPVLKQLVQSSEYKKCIGTRLIVCAYHNADDEKSVKDIFQDEKTEIHTNAGYIFFMAEQQHKPPYFRRGVLFINQI